MSSHKIIAISGNLSRPSKSRALVDAAVDLALRGGLEIRTYDLVDAQPGLGAASTREALTLPAARIVEAIEEADGLIVGTPVHKGAYTGLFKHLIDFVRPDALVGKPVLLTAVGGGTRHALMVEHALRPLFASFPALTVPTAVYAAAPDFAEGRLVDPGILTRVADAVDEFTALVRHAAGQERAAPRQARVSA